jgi:hypothetical protein
MIPATARLSAAMVQAPPSAATVDAVTARFLALETKLAGAVQHKDGALLDSLLAPGFAYSQDLEAG